MMKMTLANQAAPHFNTGQYHKHCNAWLFFS